MDIICSCSYNGALQRAENHSAVYHQIYRTPLPQGCEADAVAMCYGTPQSAPRLQSSLPVPHQQCCPAIRLLHACAPSESVHLAHTALFVLLKGRGKTLHCFFSVCLFALLRRLRRTYWKLMILYPWGKKHLSVSCRFPHTVLPFNWTFLPSKEATTVTTSRWH